MKLFAIRNTTTNELVPNLFFNDKTLAKRKRTEINPRDESGAEILVYVVTFGPDHYKSKER